MSEAFLITLASLNEILPGRWWVPSTALLDSIEPGRTHVKVLAAAVGEDGGCDPSQARAVWVAIDEAQGDGITGTVIGSSLDVDGFRKGDRVGIERGHIFDLAFFSDDRPLLNLDRALAMRGRRALVGVTNIDRDDNVIDREQFVGRIADVDASSITLEVADGSARWLPPDVRPFDEAWPGEYRLRDTGELVVDPDYVVTWTRTPPA